MASAQGEKGEWWEKFKNVFVNREVADGSKRGIVIGRFVHLGTLDEPDCNTTFEVAWMDERTGRYNFVTTSKLDWEQLQPILTDKFLTTQATPPMVEHVIIPLQQRNWRASKAEWQQMVAASKTAYNEMKQRIKEQQRELEVIMGERRPAASKPIKKPHAMNTAAAAAAAPGSSKAAAAAAPAGKAKGKAAAAAAAQPSSKAAAAADKAPAGSKRPAAAAALESKKQKQKAAQEEAAAAAAAEDEDEEYNQSEEEEEQSYQESQELTESEDDFQEPSRLRQEKPTRHMPRRGQEKQQDEQQGAAASAGRRSRGGAAAAAAVDKQKQPSSSKKRKQEQQQDVQQQRQAKKAAAASAGKMYMGCTGRVYPADVALQKGDKRIGTKAYSAAAEGEYVVAGIVDEVTVTLPTKSGKKIVRKVLPKWEGYELDVNGWEDEDGMKQLDVFKDWKQSDKPAYFTAVTPAHAATEFTKWLNSK